MVRAKSKLGSKYMVMSEHFTTLPLCLFNRAIVLVFFLLALVFKIIYFFPIYFAIACDSVSAIV